MRHVWALLALAAVAGCAGAHDSTLNGSMARYRTALSPQWAAADDGTRTDAANDGWLVQAKALSQPSSQPNQPVQQGAREYVPWQKRYGPAYSDFPRSLGRDGKEFLPIMLDDTRVLVTNPWSIAGIALAGAAGISLASSGVDNHVADHYTRHGSDLNTFWDSVGDAGGNPATHFAIAGAAWLTTLAIRDIDNYEKSKTLLHALALNGIITTGLKVAADTRSPNGDRFGWPSGHASSSFCFATVLYEEYGPAAGLPAYAFAAFVGYERIDARNHDFSDVVSGALLGMAIGHAVCRNHKARIAGMEVAPFVDPRGGVGVGLAKAW